LHGLTGSVNIFRGTAKKFIEDYHIAKDSYQSAAPSIFSQLRLKKYLVSKVEDRKNYQLLLQRIVSNTKKIKKVFVSINPTETCNLACPYCVNSYSRARISSTIMSFSQLKEIFSILDSWKIKGINVAEEAITLIGGEPLLPSTKLIVEKIALACKKRNLHLKISTNGTYLLDYLDLIKKFLNVFTYFQITIDGPREIHNQRRKNRAGIGYFDQIASGIAILLKLKRRVLLRSNFDDSNIDYLPQLAKFIKEMGWHKNINFRYNPHPVISKLSRSQDHSCSHLFNLASFYKRINLIIKKNAKVCSFIRPLDFMETEELLLRSVYLKEIITKFFPSVICCASCGAHSYTFAPNNKIYACSVTAGIKEFCLGEYYPRLKLDKINLELWKNRSANKIRSCKNCKFIFLCAGNCPLVCYIDNGSINENSLSCQKDFQKGLEVAAEILKDDIKKRILQASKHPFPAEPS
jgi:uncharacterized protein